MQVRLGYLITQRRKLVRNLRLSIPFRKVQRIRNGKMLLVRSRLEETGRGVDASTSYPTFQARVAPILSEPVVPFGVSPFAGSAYAWFKAAQRAARYTTRELATALARAAEVDVQLRNSAPPLETLSAYVGEIIAGQ